MSENDKAARQTMMMSALDHLQQAIDLLDQAEAPGQIAAHADLAVHQLAEALGVDVTATPGPSGSLDFERLATFS
jgi:hypothetical protein